MAMRIHRAAETLMGEADRARAEGLEQEARDLLADAARAETTAFLETPVDKVRTRGILAVSAVSLFHQANMTIEAERTATMMLAHEGLSEDTRSELLAVLQNIEIDGLQKRPVQDVLPQRLERPRTFLAAEYYPRDTVTHLFRPPPDVPVPVLHHNLIVGAAGSGKTILLRYMAATHAGAAIELDLCHVLAPVGWRLRSPAHFDAMNEPERLQVVDRTVALLSLAVAIRALDAGLQPPASALAPCLPRGALPRRGSLDRTELRTLMRHVSELHESAFEALNTTPSFERFVGSLADLAADRGQPLLLLFDRAEGITGPSIYPITRLFRDASCRVVVAMRPSVFTGGVQDDVPPLAGYDFDLWQLGASPGSHRWRGFVDDVLDANLGPDWRKLPSDAVALLHILSRDSLRTALELATAAMSDVKHAWPNLIAMAHRLRERDLMVTQSLFAETHLDYRRLLGRVQNDAFGNGRRVTGPLVIRPTLDIESSTAVRSLFDGGLRISALCTPQGRAWIPAGSPQSAEIPPLYLWSQRASFSEWHARSPTTVEFHAADLVA